MILQIENEQDQFEISPALEQLIKTTIETTLELEDFDNNSEVSLTFVSAQAIQELNKTYREKDSVTDVLSFPQYTEEGWDAYEDEPVMLGDIVICLERAQEQAQEYGHSFDREVAYLVCHSTLHLLGYDHLEAQDKSEMRTCEERIMKAMGLERVMDNE